MPNQLSTQRQPYALKAEEGPVFWILGLPGQAKASGAQTGGTFSLVEALCPPGYATPLHIHYQEDEALYVLAGELRVTTGGVTVRAAAGSFVYQPRGIAHGFRVDGDTPARLLCQTVPAGVDHGPPEGTTQPSVLGPAALELETLADLGARYQIDVLGPLPELAEASEGRPAVAAVRRGRSK
jgi:quercetin dioxygenase-like cupin family protein